MIQFDRRLSQKEYFGYVYSFPFRLCFPYINRISYTINAIKNFVESTMVSEVKVSQRMGVEN